MYKHEVTAIAERTKKETILQQPDRVTFAAGLLDRAGHLRSDPGALADMLATGGACVLPLWHGKILTDAEPGGAGLTYLAADHPALGLATEQPLFLGRADGHAVFAADISPWSPPQSAPPRDGAAFLDRTRQPLPGSPGAFTELRAVMAALTPLEAEIAATARSMLSWHASHGFCAKCGARSVIMQGGWQRGCPRCNAQHFPRTDPVVIMLVTHGNSVLLGRSPGWPEGMYSLLAGVLEPGESVEAAVRREVAEETGVEVGAVGFLASPPWPHPSSLMLGCRARARRRALTLDPVEMEDALWLSREQLVQVFAGRHPRIRPPRAGAIAQFLLKNWLADRLD